MDWKSDHLLYRCLKLGTANTGTVLTHAHGVLMHLLLKGKAIGHVTTRGVQQQHLPDAGPNQNSNL